MRNLSLFEGERLTLDDAIEMSVASLTPMANGIPTGQSATVAARIARLPWPLCCGHWRPARSSRTAVADRAVCGHPAGAATAGQAALRILDTVRERGYEAQVVLPAMDDRFYVYMLGRGVPPPKNRFRWCTAQLKIEPMHAALTDIRERTGQKLLMLTGVRLGESAVRDARIAVSCSKDSGECGQGWFQVATPESIADTLAPLLHWRLCHVFDWLYFEPERHGLDTSGVAAVYGEDDIRTGCVGCNLASRDNALERLIRQPEWEHLRPLMELKPLFAELTMAKHRKRKSEPELRQDGQWAHNAQRLGPLTMEARCLRPGAHLDIQQRARVDLINADEEARIRELWALNTWPNKWTGDEIDGDEMIDAYTVTALGDVISQPLLTSQFRV